MVSKDTKNTKIFIRDLLAEHLGVEPEDINDEDSFAYDLHMRATDLSDFLVVLNGQGIDTSNLDMSEIETFEDFIEALGLEEFTN